MSIVTYKRGDKTALTKNFTRDEFECQCKKCDAQMIDLELVDKLQSIRDVLGVKLKVTSGYRCITHNAKVHGSSHSKHLYQRRERAACCRDGEARHRVGTERHP